MRLTTKEVAEIINICQTYCQSINAELRIYGHRASDFDEGNDMGLLFIVESTADEQYLSSQLDDLTQAVKTHLNDTSITSIVTTRDELRHHPKAHDLLPKSLFLYAYKAQ